MKHKGIETKKNIAFGKPVIAGTRISIEFILDLLASGWTSEKILKQYPHLKKEGIISALKYSRDIIKEWKSYPLTSQ